jgi:hypothetical protein
MGTDVGIIAIMKFMPLILLYFREISSIYCMFDGFEQVGYKFNSLAGNLTTEKRICEPKNKVR